MPASEPVLLGIDVGGTFTDVVLLDENGLHVLKLPSTPGREDKAVIDGLERIGAPTDARFTHGTTVATNALLQHRGARAGLLCTRGVEDVLVLGRQQRPHLYRTDADTQPPLVPHALRIGVNERMVADGSALIELSETEIRRVVTCVSTCESVAVSLLFSCLNPAHELLLERALLAARPGIHVTLSHRLVSEPREFERTATTVANAFVGPVVADYLDRLADGIGTRTFSVMHSGGGSLEAETAAREAARLVLSGPAGGVLGAFRCAMDASEHAPVLMTLDMGGTSTDVCLCDGQLPLTNESSIAGIPMRLPAIDIHTVGAGGGSIAFLDAGGGLRVGPESAGADPGPACYGRGGFRATVTDAQLILGRLAPKAFLPSLGRELELDSAYRALDRAGPPGWTAEKTALGIIDVVEASMERALRHISVERGHDPRTFTLVPFGGAGPLHACALAEGLGMKTVFIPRWPGVLSAIGLARSDRVVDASRAVIQPLAAWAASPDAVDTLDRLRRDVESRMGASLEGCRLDWSADCRYAGQSWELTIPAGDLDDRPDSDRLTAAFHRLHRERFDFMMEERPIDVVAFRLRAVADHDRGRPEYVTKSPENDKHVPPAPFPVSGSAYRRVVFSDGPLDSCPVLDRDVLMPGAVLHGPALIEQIDSTILVEPGWTVGIDVHENILMTRTGGAP